MSPGLAVMVEDSCSKGGGFESQHHILDRHISHIFVVKIVMMFVWKDQNLTINETGLAHFLWIKKWKIFFMVCRLFLPKVGCCQGRAREKLFWSLIFFVSLFVSRQRRLFLAQDSLLTSQQLRPRQKNFLGWKVLAQANTCKNYLSQL